MPALARSLMRFTDSASRCLKKVGISSRRQKALVQELEATRLSKLRSKDMMAELSKASCCLTKLTQILKRKRDLVLSATRIF